MYCANCGTPRTQGLSYCNRCGADLREHVEPTTNTAAISAFLTAITLLGIGGLAVMLAGALLLRKGANLSQELICIFMLFTFLIVSITEIMLVKNLRSSPARLNARNSLLRSQCPNCDCLKPRLLANLLGASLKTRHARSSTRAANTLKKR